MSGRAFILRMNPAGVPRAAVGLQTNEISIGWGKCGAELLKTNLDRSAFAMHVHRTYNAADGNRIASGNSAGQLWRFIRVMSAGDLVVVPLGDRLHLAEVLGDAGHTAVRYVGRRTRRARSGNVLVSTSRRVEVADDVYGCHTRSGRRAPADGVAK